MHGTTGLRLLLVGTTNCSSHCNLCVMWLQLQPCTIYFWRKLDIPQHMCITDYVHGQLATHPSTSSCYSFSQRLRVSRLPPAAVCPATHSSEANGPSLRLARYTQILRAKHGISGSPHGASQSPGRTWPTSCHMPAKSGAAQRTQTCPRKQPSTGHQTSPCPPQESLSPVQILRAVASVCSHSVTQLCTSTLCPVRWNTKQNMHTGATLEVFGK